MIAGATFVVGATLGGGVGYRTAVGASQADVDRPADPPPEDDELVELRRLAVDAPIEELIARRLVFLRCATVSYRTDTVLWRGIERLCDAVVRDPAFPDRRLSGRLLAQIIEYAEPEFQRAHAHRVADLRALP